MGASQLNNEPTPRSAHPSPEGMSQNNLLLGGVPRRGEVGYWLGEFDGGGFSDVGESPAEFFAEDAEKFGGLETDEVGGVGRSLHQDPILGQDGTAAVSIHHHHHRIGCRGENLHRIMFGKDKSP